VVLPYYLFHVEKRVCLSRDVWVTGAAWRASMRIEARVGDLLQRVGDYQAQVVYSVARRSRSQLMLCKVSTVHKEMRNASFLV
jgi:hypothetical protein